MTQCTRPASPPRVPVLEAVVNVSEGRDDGALQAIVDAAQAQGASVLHVDVGRGAHRTVLTLAGAPEGVVQAVRGLVGEALARIDLREHRGAHPRLGAVDVVPLVGLQDLRRDEVAALARALGAQLAQDHGLPVYLYGDAASAPHRRSLARLRRGEAEALPRKLGRLPPDFGPRQWHPDLARSGAMVVGARGVLVAWNVTLDTTDLSVAQAIAAAVRTSSGGLPAVRALGWVIPEYGRVQVSTNLLDWRQTSPWTLTQAVRREAARAGVGVAGAELIGLVPEAALLQDAPFEGLPHSTRLDRVVSSLGLDHLGAFDLDTRLLERRLPDLRRGPC